MTSLFAELVALACGDTVPVLPRPRMLFESEAQAAGLEYAEPVAEPRAERDSDPRPAGELNPPPGEAELPKSKAAKSIGMPFRSPAQEGKPVALRQVASPAVLPPRPSSLRIEPQGEARRAATKDGQSPSRHEVRYRGGEARAQGFTPLLPRQSEPDAAMAPSASNPAKEQSEVAGDTPVSLTIGRIEVRPAPAPGPRKAAPVPTQPVILKRAPVRQTLDDYRSRQRR